MLPQMNCIKMENILCRSSNFDDPKKTIDYYLDLINKYPIKSIEDPFAEDDWTSWTEIYAIYQGQ